MATQAQYDAVIQDRNAANNEAAWAEGEAATANAQAVEYRAKTEDEIAIKHAATADAQRIEAKLDALKAEADRRLKQQQADTERRAKQVEQNAQAEILKLEKEAMTQIAALFERLNKTRNPVTGRRTVIDNVLESLFELHRENALTAQEYSELQIPAAVYDLHQLEGLAYDLYGKNLLKAFGTALAEITAGEYDALKLTADEFEAYALTAAEYELYAKALLV